QAETVQRQPGASERSRQVGRQARGGMGLRRAQEGGDPEPGGSGTNASHAADRAKNMPRETRRRPVKPPARRADTGNFVRKIQQTARPPWFSTRGRAVPEPMAL